VLRRIALLVAVAALLVVMTASIASAQPGGTTNPCPPGEFLVFDPETGLPICAPASEVKGKKGPLPPTGGSASVVPVAAALLLGTGLVTYAVLRRR
jgi:hypothetical protein